MSLLDKVVGSMGNAADTIGRYASEASEKSKIRACIDSENSKIQQAYNMLGYQYFQKHAANPEPEFAENVQSIRASMNAIADFEKQLAQVNSLGPTGGKFCANCGNRLDGILSKQNNQESYAHKATTQSAPSKKCPCCGADVSPDQEICNECMTLLD